jgi:hypothetical protein
MGGPWNRRKRIKRMPPKKTTKRNPKPAKKGRRKRQ